MKKKLTISEALMNQQTWAKQVRPGAVATGFRHFKNAFGLNGPVRYRSRY